MILPSLHIDDDLAQAYMAEAVERRVPVEQVLQERLASSAPLDPRQRYLILIGEPREQLEIILGGGTLKDLADLVTKVRRLASIKFGAHELQLTAGQLEEIKWRAGKQGRTIDQMVQAAWTRFKEQFFTLVP